MTIIYNEGDFLLGSEPYKAHGCNKQGGFGAGVAKHIRTVYPEAYHVYRDHYKEHGLKMGEVIYAHVAASPQPIICHCITQEFYGNEAGRIYVDYDAVRACMKELNKCAEGQFVALPKIGAGLAGGDWEIIADIIEEEFTNTAPVVYVYK